MIRDPLLDLAVNRGLVAAPASGSDAASILRSAGLDETQIAELRLELERSEQPPPIPGYRLIERIGRGAHSQVWRASQEAVEREVAVKIIPARRPRDIERFLREARAAGAIGSPYVVTCHEAGQSGDALFLVMELLAEGDAEALAVAQGGRLPERRAVEIVRDAARGLSALFSAGLTHRDIKPANILLSGSGAKLADLGLALDAEAPLHRTAQSSMGEGTPAFMSPEQVRGEQLDVRSDLFSLGATFYRLVTGALPFPGRTVVETLHLIDQRTAPDPIDAAPDLPDGTRLMIQVAMSRSRGLRYQHPDQFAEDADSVLNGRPPLHARRLRQHAYDSHIDQRPAMPAVTIIRPWQLVVALLATLMVGLLAGRGLGGPSSVESALFAQAHAVGDAAAWRRYLDQFPHGDGREEAEAQLALLADVERAAPAAERAQLESARMREEIARLLAARSRGAQIPMARGAAAQPAPPSEPRRPAVADPAAVEPGADSHQAAPAAPAGGAAAAAAPPPLLPQPAAPAPLATRPGAPAPPSSPSVPAASEVALKAHMQRFPFVRPNIMAGLTCHPGDPASILAWDPLGMVWRSSDGTKTWRQMASTVGPFTTTTSSYWGANAKMLFIPTEGINYLGCLSEDGGKSFDAVPIPPPQDDPLLHRAVKMTLDEKVMLADGELFIAGLTNYDSGQAWTVLGSEDRGRTWRTRMSCPTKIMALYPTDVGVLVIAYDEAGSRGMRVSADLGRTWTHFAGADGCRIGCCGTGSWSSIPPLCSRPCSASASMG
jgi:hypothetical protein